MHANKKTTLTVLVPVYNERYLVEESLGRLKVLAQCPALVRVQVVVVDDCSKDGSAAIVEAFIKRQKPGKLRWELLRHPQNQGKGAAIRTALARADEEITIIHDADLEYHPEDIPGLLGPFLEDHADAVFGSRFQARHWRRVLHYRHELGNRFLTFCCNVLSDYNLTDMETCYKAIRTELFKSIPLESRDFRMEPEITLKLAKRNARLFEVPISYSGRTYQEGKKIGWQDGVKAFTAMLRFWWSDHVFVEESFGLRNLKRLASASQFNAWLAGMIRPHVGAKVLELDAASGHLTQALVPRDAYVATDSHPIHRFNLRTLALSKPYLKVCGADAAHPEGFPRLPGGYDTVLAVNVIEHVDEDAQALSAMARLLSPGGRLVLVAPHGPWLMGSLDEVFGHRRRYTRQGLESLVAQAGLQPEKMQGFNRLASLAWWLNGRVLKRRTFGRVQLAVFDFCIPLLARLDPWLPFPPQSLLVVARRPLKGEA
jgi:glycosyltransferase involved in cell wall biosynthesis